MARVKRGVIARARHKKILKQAKGYYGARSRVYRVAFQAVIKAGQYAYRDRRQRKRQFRQLWIARINAAARQNGNPQVIFVQDRYPQVVKQIENDPQWQTIDAVKHHRVWLMPEYAKAWGYPMPEALALGELWMAKKLYPARYQSIDVDSKARDYYQRFYRVAWTPDAR